MFDFIKKLFGGLFSFLGGLFGGKKKSYYLELDDAGTPVAPADSTPVAPEKPAPAPAKAPAAPAPVAVETPAPAPAPAPPKAPEPPATGTFAPDYLLYTTTRAKRRPGPSLKGFRDMARQVNKMA
ncbi:hypothetical protein K4A83_08195 [Spirulina subsalsa FACHB-351]|uniref:Uncharacterized protein n=1 Tax=Spirulina subsalsa FACHB-351 TaxID=234711 RepID=A0ABT3L411_9CYAN|nr:hypothetical protein [Spirulina subsalsa]MCW6036251.1 hypothetical protein [Spirulina subsalsa FACHB-351]